MDEITEGFGSSFALFADPLLQAIREENYSGAYALLRRKEYPEGEEAAWELLTAALERTPRLFGRLLDVLGETVDLARLTGRLNAYEMTVSGRALRLEGSLGAAAAMMGRAKHLDLLLERGLVAAGPEEGTFLWVQGLGTVYDLSPLGAAVGGGCLTEAELLLTRQDLSGQDCESLRRFTLLGLYADRTSLSELGRVWAAEAVARKLYGVETLPLFQPTGEGEDETELLAEPVEPPACRLRHWVSAQFAVAPVEQLHQWLESGVYGSEELEVCARDLHAWEERSGRECLDLKDWQEENRRVYERVLLLLRFRPELCCQGLLLNQALRWSRCTREELSLLRQALLLREGPVDLGVEKTLRALESQPSGAQKELLALMKDTCGAVLDAWDIPEYDWELGSLLPALLEYAQLRCHPGEAGKISPLTLQIVRKGSAALLKRALKLGCLEHEPLGPLVELMREGEATALIPLVLAHLPHRDRDYDL